MHQAIPERLHEEVEMEVDLPAEVDIDLDPGKEAEAVPEFGTAVSC